jgi:hypothetical protein
MKDDDEKSSLRHWEPIPIFFIIPLSILEQFKRKAAAGAGCTFGIRILIADYHPVTYEKLKFSIFFYACVAHSGLYIIIAGVAVYLRPYLADRQA